MTYLITGATGLLGNNLTRTLLRRGHRVRIVVRRPPEPRVLAGLPVESIQADLTDRLQLVRAMEGVSWVIHSAGDTHIGWRCSPQQEQTNVQGTQAVACAAREAGASLVHVSSVDALAASVDGTPVDEETPDRCKLACSYVVTKRAAEAAVREEMDRGLAALIVNPGFMMGPWDWKPSSGRMLLGLARGWMPAAPGGGMSACDVRDVADAIVVATERNRTARRYILAGENITYLRAWQLFAQTAGRPAPLLCYGPLVRWAIGAAGDLWTQISGTEPAVNSALVRMSQMLHYYSSERARRELDYSPRPFASTVLDAWHWFQQYEYLPTQSTRPTRSTIPTSG